MSDVLAVAEHRQGELRDVSYELVTAGRELAAETGGELHLAVISGDTDAFAAELARDGVDTIHTVAYGDEFNHDVYTQALDALTDDLQPAFVLAPHTINGLDYVPAVAESRSLPLVTDVVEFQFDDDTLSVTREENGGKVEVAYDITGEPALLTVRPAEWPQTESAGDTAVTAFDADIDEDRIGSTVTGYEAIAGGDIDIGEADVLISIGRGIEEEENLELIEALGDVMGHPVSSSRPIVDNGWLPANRQVGQSGKTVTPEIYLAIGISGAVQHVAGMKGSETIIAINNDPNAPIFDIADYGIVNDLFDVVPELIESLGDTAPDI